jgi:hypothetical protein
MPPEDILLCYFNVLTLNNASRGEEKTSDAKKSLAPNQYRDFFTWRGKYVIYIRRYLHLVE